MTNDRIDHKREFITNPSIESARKYIADMRRYDIPLPTSIGDIASITKDKLTLQFFVEAMDYGDPSYLAYCLVLNFGTSKKWAEKVIENDNGLLTPVVAYNMVKYHGSDREWAERIIVRSRSHSCRILMVEDCGSSQEWLEGVES